MSLFSGIFGGGGSSSSSVSASNVSVTVNPEITNVIDVDLQPVQNLVDQLTATQARGEAALVSSSLINLAAAQTTADNNAALLDKGMTWLKSGIGQGIMFAAGAWLFARAIK